MNRHLQFKSLRKGLWQACGVCIIGILMTSGSGCRNKEEEPETEDTIREYASLAKLRETHHEGLQNELARLEAEKSTLMALGESQRPTNEMHDLNLRLEKALPDVEETVRIRERLSPFPPRELPYLDSVQASQLAAIMKGYERHRRMIEEAADQPKVRAWVDYRMGLAADVDFVDRLEAGFMLESAQAAIKLYEQNPSEALSSLERMLSYSRKLAEVWHIVPRLKAADLRSDACFMISGIANHPATTSDELNRLRNLLVSQLANWSQESNSWIGDRAIGLHTYEMVRDGQYLSLLTPTEISRLKDERVEYATAKRVYENVDEDEAYYLQTMRRLIDSTSKPYHLRGAAAAAAQTALNDLKDSDHYPSVAVELLLIDYVPAQRRLAADRARIEAWALCLSVATDTKRPSGTVNPQSGVPYEVVEEDGYVRVDGLDLSRNELTPQAPKVL